MTFDWTVEPQGYDIVTGIPAPYFSELAAVSRIGVPEDTGLGRRLVRPSAEEPVLCPIPRTKRTGSRKLRSYQPLLVRGLFMTFAELTPDNQQIVAFANKYGFLGLRPALPVNPQEEPVSRWQFEIRQLSKAVAEWRSFDSDPHPDSSYVEVLNVVLRDRVPLRVNWDAAMGWFSMLPTPTNLIGALWLQFAEAVSRKTEWKACKYKKCGRLFEVAAGRNTGRKAGAEFHSEACKTNHYRDRRRFALELHEQGKKTPRIAEMLDTKETTVRDWIRRFKSEESF